VLAARTAGVSDPDLSYAVTTPALTSPWVAVESVEPARRARWSPPEETLPELGIAAFTRRVDTSWRRTSYSGLTASVHEAERRPSGFRDDEPDEVVADLAPVGDAEGLLSPFADMPAGAAFGTLVHGVLESVDTDRDDLADELLARSRERLGVFPVAEISAQDLSDALLPALRTPLGEIAGNVTLAQIPTRDRLAELDFELPMGQMSTATLSDLARLLRRHLPAGDPLIEYPERLDSPGLAESTLVGYLSGSIDAVLRVDSSRFLVVDYKTNLLRDPAAPGTERLVDGYHRQALATAMMDAHYPLQALLYAAALHRYLRWRLPGYDPRVNFGGVLYLFLRGMAGPQTPPGHGVFDWQPPPALIVALSDLLDGRP
jgi:exodeoxyribonuclease V beta subunit